MDGAGMDSFWWHIWSLKPQDRLSPKARINSTASKFCMYNKGMRQQYGRSFFRCRTKPGRSVHSRGPKPIDQPNSDNQPDTENEPDSDTASLLLNRADSIAAGPTESRLPLANARYLPVQHRGGYRRDFR